MIHVKNVCFQYRSKEMLFYQMNTVLERGNIYGLLGGNGEGKSTLLKMIGGFITPQKGEVLVNDWHPSERTPEFLSNVYYLPEDIWLPDLTLKRYVELYSVFYPNFNHSKFESYIKQFGLEGELGRNSKAFSYGQKKKFMISFALATECEVLLMDEPTNGLDVTSKTTFRQLITMEISEDRLMVISTHQVRDLMHLMDPIIILKDGEVCCNHSLEELEKMFHFKHYRTKELMEQTPLFMMQGLGGIQCIEPALETSVSEPIDLEFFYSAINSDQKEELIKLMRS
ncbi:ABC transporter ATP-binding protein [Halosquirtibacter xylanolyticus]|uniref:ABC transporter ATP-binding protein n=1 Tax=Halosquirtibacter xylanolyticus TaxID=3374599 RepID=UPI003748C626|nr:ABC transporter ATP-binding protein [Prolixibacteraceae bacterium]